MPRGTSKYAKKAPAGRHRKSQRKRARKPTKRQLVSARQPIVETKKKVYEPSAPFTATELTAQLSVMIPDAWEKQSQGYRDDDVVGTSIFMKYLTTKFYFNFNQGGIVSKPDPIDLRFIIGWCKLPQNIAEQDVAEVGPPSKVKGVVYNFNPEQHVANYLKVSLDNPLESLDRSVFQIHKDFRFAGMPRTAVQPAAAGSAVHYTRKNLWLSHTWKPMKKLKLQLVTESNSGNGTHFSPCNKEGQWIPFVAIYNINSGNFPSGSCPTYLTKSASYYTDS